MKPLADRVALVTGASRGIGAATATALRDAGARVIRVARSLAPGTGDGFHDLAADVTDPGQVEGLAEGVGREHGVPDVVINCAGGFLLRDISSTGVAEFDAQLAVNLRAPFLLARSFLPRMRSAGRGLFVSVGSVADHVGLPENSAYAASKYGLRGMHETLLAEYRGSGVRLTLVSPGATDTPIWDPIDPEQHPGLPERRAMLRPGDVAEAILFIATRPPHVLIDWLRLGPV